MIDPKAAWDGWLEGEAPRAHVVISARARFARNLAASRFAPHASADERARVDALVRKAMETDPVLREFSRLELGGLPHRDRMLLKEARLISSELERAAEGRTVYLAPDRRASVMVNEEDHLRIQCLEPGARLDEAVARLEDLERRLAQHLAFATHDRLGYLTACPTNVGTGLRASCMLHLPALTITREIEGALSGLGRAGLTVRGFNGENSEFLGDFYQISNEVTLGRTTKQITKDLVSMIDRVATREEDARTELFRQRAELLEDAIWRSFAVLTYARRMTSKEAMALLSRLRLGIDRQLFPRLSHRDLNRLFIEIQPGHLGRTPGAPAGDEDTASRDEARAEFLRARLHEIAERN
jgi:protein arginine kinase